jgi:hypothetical protein
MRNWLRYVLTVMIYAGFTIFGVWFLYYWFGILKDFWVGVINTTYFFWWLPGIIGFGVILPILLFVQLILTAKVIVETQLKSEEEKGVSNADQ